MSLGTFTSEIVAIVEAIDGQVAAHVNVGILDQTIAAALKAGDGFAGVLEAVLADSGKIFSAPAAANDRVAAVLAATHAAVVHPAATPHGASSPLPSVEKTDEP